MTQTGPAYNRAVRALNRLTKWRGHLAGWQLGTRVKGDPESDAVRDHREATLLLRVEGSALIGLLLEKGVFTQDEWLAALEREADQLNEAYAQRWPGAKATHNGMSYDLAQASGWMKDWRP